MTSHSLSTIGNLVLRPALLFLLLSAPVLAMPVVQPVAAHIIEAPAPQAKGLGFVLTVILQRR